MATLTDSNPAGESATSYLGLAPFLRMSIAGTDYRHLGQQLLASAERHPDDANLWMNLSTVLLSLGQRELGLQVQAQALNMQRLYHLAAARQPARFRLLVLVVPGDLAANTPIDCLLEDSDIDLILHYVDAGAPLQSPLPEHDAVLVGISAADEWRALLATLAPLLADWPTPVINAPARIPATDRNTASALLRDAPGVLIPPTLRAPRAALQDIATGAAQLAERFADCDFPIIVRPVGSHAGHDLDRIERPEEISAYLARVGDAEFFISRFVDYRGDDRRYRKFRIALIDGQAFACHMAVSSHWMVHYVNADMYQDAGKRAEEAAFMAHFDDFVQRHRAALEAIHARTGLDYLCIDGAETPDGQLLVFEIDHAMVVHAMDPVDLFPYKQPHMQAVQDAFRAFLFRLGGDRISGPA